MRPTLFAQAAGLCMIAALATGPADAQGKKDRARMAVTEAQAKVEAAMKVDASTLTPKLLADAQATLRTAQEDLAQNHKDDAIATANRASQLADQALGESQRRRAENNAAVRSDAVAATASAQAEADAAKARAADAEQSAAAAQAQAASAQAEAAALRATPPAQPASTTTTTTVEQPVAATTAARATTTKHVVRKTTARRTTAKPAAVKTTTTVTTQN